MKPLLHVYVCKSGMCSTLELHVTVCVNNNTLCIFYLGAKGADPCDCVIHNIIICNVLVFLVGIGSGFGSSGRESHTRDWNLPLGMYYDAFSCFPLQFFFFIHVFLPKYSIHDFRPQRVLKSLWTL